MKGHSGIGMRKHGRSGHSGKSPKLRLALRRDAEKDERRLRNARWLGRLANCCANGNSTGTPGCSAATKPSKEEAATNGLDRPNACCLPLFSNKLRLPRLAEAFLKRN